MTYLPTNPPGTTPNAGPLSDADLLSLGQAGVTRRTTLATFKAFILAGATGSTGGSTGGTTGSTGTAGGSTGGVAPAGRLGYPANTPVMRNTATTPAPVTVPTAPKRSLPAFTQTAGESPRGKVINSSNYSTDHITLADGTTFGLAPSTASYRAGLFTIQKNGATMTGIRLDLMFGNGFNAPAINAFDDVVQLVYYGTDVDGHNAYAQTDHGLGDTTWFKIEGSGPDMDTEGGDPRITALVDYATAPVGDPPYGLGTHPGSIGDEPRFGQWLAQFNKEVGLPSYVNAFADAGDFSKWGNNAYAAAQDLYNVSPNKSIIPVYGLPMARGGQALNDFNAFANGTYDQYIKDGVKGYLAFFDECHVRPGYEANGTFMNWFWGGQNGDNSLNAPWIAAFKRIYQMAKQAGVEASQSSGKTKTVLVTWNPCHQNYNSGSSPRDMYPGDAYCDYHGLDIYSPNYAQDATNWSGDGVTYSSDKARWSVQKYLNPLNRIHFWDYPAAKGDGNPVDPTGGTAGWGLQDAMAFALAHGKPLAFPECGAGSNAADASGGTLGDVGCGPVEDFVFPYYLRSRCDQFVNMGGKILYLNIWAADEKDGGWGFMFRQRPTQAYAWSAAFGGTGAALKFLGAGAGSGSSIGSTGSGSTGSTGGSTGTTGSTGGGSTGTSTGLATAVVTDTSGHTATITLPATPASGSPPFYGSDTGLSADMYYYSYNGQLTLGCSAAGVIASIALNRNGNNIIVTDDLLGVTTYSGSTSGGSTGSTGGGSGVATAKITDTSGNVANLTLSGYHDYYGSGNDTNLTCNIYFYLDGGTNKPTIGSSADGVIASIAITENGAGVVVTTSLAGVTTYA